jgi:thiazole synthase ThiGH ThiG subunit
MEDKLIIKGIEFRSRLWVGTGKYRTLKRPERPSRPPAPTW